MDAKTAIDVMLHNATGKRASGREMLLRPKKSRLTPEAAAVLKEQWNSAGRDNAFVVMMLAEEDGSNPHLVTGWNGKDTFVCLTENGLCYVDHRHLDKLKVESRWDPKTRLIDIRAHQLTEDDGDGMSGTEVDMLLNRIKRTLKKSSKKRRKGRLRNMEKFFNIAVVESHTNAEKAANSGPDSELEFDKVDEKDDRIPEGLKEPSTTKLPKDAKGKQTHRESFNWDLKGRDGRPVRRGLTHWMMQENSTDPQTNKREHVRMDKEGKGGSVGATPGGNKADPQMGEREHTDVRSEDYGKTDPQLPEREHVPVRREGGKWNQGTPTPGGNKTDPQMNDREQVAFRSEDFARWRSEEKAHGATDSSDKSDKDGHLTYAGEKVKNTEMSARPKIAVRHEALGDDKAQKLFGPGSGKKAPMGAKKPLLMLVLMGKGKKAPKRNMSENLSRSRLKLARPVSESTFSNIQKMRNKAKARFAR